MFNKSTYSENHLPNLTAQIILFDGFDELDAVGPFEVLKLAAFDVTFVALETAAPLIGAHGLKVYPDKLFTSENRPNFFIVPGGGWLARSPKSVHAEIERGEIPKIISYLHKEGVIIASVCTGAMLLAAAGILSQRPAITHHSAVHDLRKTGAIIIDAKVVDNGSIITAGGVTSGIDLALWITERFRGKQVADEVERSLEYRRNGVVWRTE